MLRKYEISYNEPKMEEIPKYEAMNKLIKLSHLFVIIRRFLVLGSVL